MGQGNSAYWLAYGPDNWGTVIGLRAGECSFFLLRNDQTNSGAHPVCLLLTHLEHAVAQLVKTMRYKAEGRGFDSQWDNWDFTLTWSFRPQYGPGVDSASNRNEYQWYILGVKGGRCVGLTSLPPSCVDCLDQRFSNFFQVGTTFIRQNVLRTTLLLGLSNSLGLP